MTDQTPVVPTPVEPPAPVAPPPDPKPAEKKLLDELKQAKAKAKELADKLAEAQPYLEKFKTHDEAKALEAQREAEARARQESENRTRQEIDSKKERAILRSLLGLNMPTEDAADFAFWKMANDPAIVFDPETGSFTGLAEARAKLAESPLFAAGKPGEPVKKPAPGLPDVKSGKPAAAPAKTYAELWQDPAAANAYKESNPQEYEQLRRTHMANQSAPRSQTFSGPGVR